MHKLLLLILCIFLSLDANEKVKIYASLLETQGNIVWANDGVTVIYENYVITAQKAKYNKQSGDLELFENIRVNQENNYKVLGKYAKLNIAKKEREFEPFYMLNKESEVWLSADNGQTKAQDVDIKSGTLSGCDPMDPTWTLDFSSTDYNTDSMWMNIYNARIYIGDIPLFYIPYFGYSLDDTRRTGLLIPEFGISNDEGFFYQQPIYIAEQDWWDLELNPQIRTNRGEGIYATFRWADGKRSKGEFATGYFAEKQDYFQKKQLQNDSHFGFNLKYDNDDFINHWFGTNIEGQSGIYADVSHMNDVDYINLRSNNLDNQRTASQVFSRINLFHNTQEHFIGAYFKYFQDLTKEDNKNTLQKIPTIQYHSYLDTFFDEHLLYSLDIQANNISREKNTNVTQTDINLPLTLRTSLFDEYLNLSYRANLYMQTSLFRGSGEEDEAGNQLDIEYENGYFARNSHTISASTQLTRAYENLSHVIGLSLSYDKSGNDIKTGFYQDYNNANAIDQANYRLYQVQQIEDAVRLAFTQYIYNEKGDEVLFHRMAQRISYSNDSEELGELENELEYRVTSYLSLYNNMFFNYEQSKFSKIFNTLRVHSSDLNINLSHLYRDSFKIDTVAYPRYTNYLTSSATYYYDSHYSYTATYNYDIEAQERKSLSIGFLYKKRCWDFGIKYSENRRPILNSVGEADFIEDRFVYITLILKPLMKANRNDSFISYRFSE